MESMSVMNKDANCQKHYDQKARPKVRVCYNLHYLCYTCLTSLGASPKCPQCRAPIDVKFFEKDQQIQKSICTETHFAPSQNLWREAATIVGKKGKSRCFVKYATTQYLPSAIRNIMWRNASQLREFIAKLKYAGCVVFVGKWKAG